MRCTHLLSLLLPACLLITAPTLWAQAALKTDTDTPAPAARLALPAQPSAAKPAPDDAAFLRGVKAKSQKQTPLAIKEFMAAAKSGHADAQHRLGKMLKEGKTNEIDYVESIRLFDASAKEIGRASCRERVYSSV